MPPPRHIARFVAVAAAIYLALAILPRVAPPWGSLHAGVFRSAGNVFFDRFLFWPEARVRFLDARSADLVGDINRAMPGELPPGVAPPQPTDEQDTLLLLLNRRVPGSIGMLLTSSRLMAYLPFALVAALTLATPAPWIRRLWALLWGVAVTQGFVLMRLAALLLYHGFAAGGKRYAVLEPGPALESVLKRADEVLADNPTFGFVAPMLIWLVVYLGFAMLDRRRLSAASARNGGRPRV